VADAEIYATPWGFSLEEVRVRVALWHGTKDRTFAHRLAKDVASRLDQQSLVAAKLAVQTWAADPPPDDAATRAELLLAQVRDRLRPDENGADFQQRYHQLVQEEPAVAVAHAEVRKLINA
jgi:type IV pilus biogenesis protein CpaD/CtpE